MCTAECCVCVHSLLMKEPPSGPLSVWSQECAEFKQQLHSASVSASALVSTTGGHFPASLCLCYGKGTRSTPERNWQTITVGGEQLRQWAD